MMVTPKITPKPNPNSSEVFIQYPMNNQIPANRNNKSAMDSLKINLFSPIQDILYLIIIIEEDKVN